ncbi:MAG: type II toxin-antitoxin system RelE/ParE family toxin [Chloroflexota bacterium]
MSVAFHPEAREELLAAAEYYESQQTGLGRRFIEAVADAVQRIQATPFMFQTVEGELRKCRVLRFPYGVIFRPSNADIYIIAVMNLRRKPGYWKRRRV